MKVSRSFLAQVLIILFFGQGTLVLANESNNKVSAGHLIAQVVSGVDFTDQELRISGIALSKTSSGAGLVSLATQKTYRSGNYENFVSVYGVPVNVSRGSEVEILAKIDESSAAKLGGKVFVTIEATYIKCIRC